MEKIKLGKHNHTFTDLLKVLIFALVMLAPFGAVLSKCLYVATNKNAKDSYYGETINEESSVQISFSDFVIGQKYNAQYNAIPYTDRKGTTYIHVSDLIINGTSKPSVTSIRYITFNNAYLLDLYQNNTTNVYLEYNLSSAALSMEFIYQGTTGDVLNTNFDNFYTIIYNNYSYLDNVFEYSIQQLPQTQIFAWTKNTALYNGVLAMTQGLGFNPNNNVLALLLTYWSLNTIIYIIFDIVIKAFTTLTHMIGNK